MSTTPASGGAPTPYDYRDDPTVPAFPDDRPVIIFDGHCVLCSGFAQFILKHDTRGTFRLLAGQTPLGQALYRHWGLDAINFETSILLYQGRPLFKSRAAIRIFQLLGFPWSASGVLRVIPMPVLDAAYDVVACHRLKWFGRREVCFLPQPGERERFLE